MNQGSIQHIQQRELASVTPIGYGIIVQVEEEKWESAIIRPDNYHKGDTTKQSFWGKVVKLAPNAEGFHDDLVKKGTRVAIDPSINIMNPARAFLEKGKHYVLCDMADVIAVDPC